MTSSSTRRSMPPCSPTRGRTWLRPRIAAVRREAVFPAGPGYHYSNTNYCVLGMLAEAVGGAPIAEQLRTRLHRPARAQRDDLPRRRDAGRGAGPRLPVRGHRPEASRRSTSPAAPRSCRSRRSSPRPAAAGSIATTATRPRPLGPGALRRRRAQRAVPPGDARRRRLGRRRYGHGIAYGLGVQSVVIDGRPTLGHSGRLLGSRAVVRWLPTESMSIAVLTNQSRTDPADRPRAAPDRPDPAGRLHDLPGRLVGPSGETRTRDHRRSRSVRSALYRTTRTKADTCADAPGSHDADQGSCLSRRRDDERLARSSGATARSARGRRRAIARRRGMASRWTDRAAEELGAVTIAADDVVLAIGDDEPATRGPRHVASRGVVSGPWRLEGDLPTMPGFDPGRALTRPSGEFVLLRDVRMSLPRSAGTRDRPSATTRS